MENRTYAYYDSPVGRLLAVKNAKGLTRVDFQKRNGRRPTRSQGKHDKRGLVEVFEQLDAYFDGTLRKFDLSLVPEGTPFQLKVWKALRDIPYGDTLSYGELARRIGNPRAARAVGAANRRNPLPIIVPCHRVIGSNGKLTGYAGGLSIKEALLGIENQANDHG